MQIIDISVPLTGSMPIWPGDPPLVLNKKLCGSITVTSMSMGLHTGTHIDVPFHFIPEGATLDSYPLHRFVGKARVCGIGHKMHIRKSNLQNIVFEQTKMLLLKTGNSGRWQSGQFCPDFIGLDEDAAQYLVNIGMKLIGIDYLSIQPFSAPDSQVHRILLSNDVLILEGINLTGVEDGDYLLSCLPLNIPGAEASPVRATLIPIAELAKEIVCQ